MIALPTGIKSFLRAWMPPAILALLARILGRDNYYTGNFENWVEAGARASGYDANQILEQVKAAALKVKTGEAVFERDSVLFDQIQYSFPVLAGLLHAATAGGNRLSVLDYGGSLGSSYYQCRDVLSVVESMQWNIVEQKHFVECGQKLFETDQLRFYHSVAECMQNTSPNVVLLSSVLQYLQNPDGLMNELMDNNISCIIIDRTPFSEVSSDRVTVQHVPKNIYPASYPCRIFSRQRFLDLTSGRYRVLAQFDSSDGCGEAGGLAFKFGGMILQAI